MYHPRIRELRVAHKLTQQQVADALGISRWEYGKIERGRRRVHAPFFLQLGAYYGVNPADLYGFDLIDTREHHRTEHTSIL